MHNQPLDMRASPDRLRVDHSPEFTNAAFAAWGKHNHVEIEFIQPSKPPQNSFIERFNGTNRDAVPNAWVFTNLAHARDETQRWLGDYNTIRPRESLGDISPIEFLTQLRGQMA